MKLSQLEQFLKAIKKLQQTVTQKKFFSEEFVQRLIERYLHLALESILDTADHIISEERFRKPETYAESILILGEERVLPRKFSEKLSKAAGFRNILVHGYVRLDPKKVYQHFRQDAEDLEKFLRYIIKFLKSR